MCDEFRLSGLVYANEFGALLARCSRDSQVEAAMLRQLNAAGPNTLRNVRHVVATCADKPL